jgi:hypothetical protein
MSASSVYEADDPINLSIQGVIPAKTDMQPRLEYRPTLTNENASRRDKLTTEALDAQSLTDTIASISRATACLFMRHSALSIDSLGLIISHTSADLIHSEECLRLTVALSFLVAFAPFVLIDEDLGAALLPHNGTHDASVFKLWLSDNDLIPFGNHQHRRNLNSISCGASQFFDRDQVPL